MAGLFRQTDAVLTIAQDNAHRTVLVTGANEVAGEVIGYPLDELKGKDFHDLVSPKIGEMIDDYVEYEDGANDVGSVLRKIRDFQLKNREGVITPYRLKIVRHHALEHSDEFLLIMQDAAKQKETTAFLQMLQENVKGHEAIRPETGLPDSASMLKALELVSYHLENVPAGATFALFQIDNYNELLSKYGVQACYRVVQSVAALCQQNLRTNDVIAQPDKNRIGLVLLGASGEPAKIVLNRLRWLVSSMHTRLDQGIDAQCTVSIISHTIERDRPAEEIYHLCRDAMDAKPEDSTNLLVQQA